MRFARTLAMLAGHDLRASRGRAIYLVVTLAITTAAWLLLAALASPFVGSTSGQTAGIIVRNGSQTSAPLPLSYARRVEATRGAEDVLWYGLQAVQCTGSTMVTLNALGGPGTAAHVSKKKVPASVIKRWQADPLGALISTAALSKCGWHVGQGIDPRSIMTSKHIALHILGTFKGTYPVAFVHYAYINRAAPGFQGKDKVVTFLAHAANPRRNERLAARFEAEFAHDFPTVNATTNATAQNAWARFGKLQQLLAFVMAAILLCAASVLVSVLAHAAAQRKPRFALLEVLGFQRATLFGAFTLELLATVVVGALLGIGLAKLVGHELVATTFGMLSGGAQIPAWAWWGLPAWLAVLVIAALAWPAASIARVHPVDYRAT